MRIRISDWVFSIALALVLSFASTSRADILFQLIGDQDWDTNSSPTGINVTFRVFANDAAPNANLLNAFSLGLRFVPVGNAEGSLQIVNGSISTLSSDPIFPAYGITTNVSDGFQTFTGDNLFDSPTDGDQLGDDVLITPSGRTLFSANIAAGSGPMPSGTFDIFASPILSGYYTSTFEDFRFGNIPDDGSGTEVRVGSITVAAVPEPGTLALLAVSLIGIVPSLTKGRRN